MQMPVHAYPLSIHNHTPYVLITHLHTHTYGAYLHTIPSSTYALHVRAHARIHIV